MSDARLLTKAVVALVEEQDAVAAADRIRGSLARDNELKVGARNLRSLVLTLTDDQGQLVGGLVGETFWNTLHVELLWVADKHRGRGYGRRLMEAAEQEGHTRGAEIAYLNTFSFQAPAFYERLGYRSFGKLEDSPKGATRMWYSKRIGDNAA